MSNLFRNVPFLTSLEVSPFFVPLLLSLGPPLERNPAQRFVRRENKGVIVHRATRSGRLRKLLGRLAPSPFPLDRSSRLNVFPVRVFHSPAKRIKAALVDWGEEAAPPLFCGMRIPAGRDSAPGDLAANGQHRRSGLGHDVVGNRQWHMAG